MIARQRLDRDPWGAEPDGSPLPRAALLVALVASGLILSAFLAPRVAPPVTPSVSFALDARIKDVDAVVGFLQEVTALWPDVVEYRAIGVTAEGREVGAVRLTADRSERKPAVWIQAGLHAREWLTHLLALNLIRLLLHDLRTESPILGALDIWIVPLANPDGYGYSRLETMEPADAPARMWRKNRRLLATGNRGPTAPVFGVDLNRNFDEAWARLGSDEPSSEVFRGATPASEAEVVAIQTHLLRRGCFVLGLDLHSGAPYQIHAPARLTASEPPGCEVIAAARAVREAFLAGAPPPRYGRAGGRFIYEASPGGQAVNFFNHRVGMTSFTVEIGQFFHAPAEAETRAILDAWLDAISAVCRLVSDGPGIAGHIVSASRGAPLAASIDIRDLDPAPGRATANRFPLPVRSQLDDGGFAAYLVPGRYRLTVRASGHAPLTRDVELDAGEAWHRCELELQSE